MKKHYLVIIIIIVLGSLWLVLKNQSSENVALNFEENIKQQGDGQLCFLYEQKASVELAGDREDAYNREYLELTIAQDGNVAGIHNIIPFGTDSNFATFIGATDGQYVNVIATANAEDKTWQEQRLYKIQDDKIFVGYQSVYVPRYQNENGIYLYEDINEILFETDQFFLEKIDCDSFDTSSVL